MKTTLLFLTTCLLAVTMHGQFLMETHSGVYNAGTYDRALTLSVYDNGHVVISDAILTGEDLLKLDAGIWAYASLDLEIDFHGRTLHLRRDTEGRFYARWAGLDEFLLKENEGC